MVIFALKRVRPFTRIFEKEGKSRLMNVVNGRELAALDVGLPTIHQCPGVAGSSSPLVQERGDSAVCWARLLLIRSMRFTTNTVWQMTNEVLQYWSTLTKQVKQNLPQQPHFIHQIKPFNILIYSWCTLCINWISLIIILEGFLKGNGRSKNKPNNLFSS